MKFIKTKALLFAIALLFLYFFSNDFGEINIEKTAIITAIAIDYQNEEYEVTAEIAVPEATDTNSENLKAEISTKGKTVAEAIKNIGSETGWYPQLYFCNLIIIGEELASTNTIEVLDFLAQTLRVQDSAEVVLTFGKGKELLEKATPLDNISSFAMQKILLKNNGFDSDVANMSIRTFNIDYYNRNSSSFMPIVEILNSSNGKNDDTASSSGGSSNSGGNQSEGVVGTGETDHYLFDASRTALFKKGKLVGTLSPFQTLVFNMLTKSSAGTRFNVTADGQDYLVVVNRNNFKIKVKADDNNLGVDISLKINASLADQSSSNYDNTLTKNEPIPKKVKEAIESKLENTIIELIETEKQTECDFLKIEEKIYRNNYKYFYKYKDNYLSKMKSNVSVSANGQK